MSDQDALRAIIPVLLGREKQAMERNEAARREAEAAAIELRNAQMARQSVERLAGIESSGVVIGLPLSANAPKDRTPKSEPYGGPEGMEAVAIALRDSETPLPLSELTETVGALGWHPDTPYPERAVRAAAARLRKKDQDYAFKAKKYMYLPRHRDQLPAPLAEVDDPTNTEP